jgi:hypothetical protein
MLHDLYLLSCYFEGPQAVLYEDDLKRRYGIQAVRDAVLQGLLELYCVPCAKNQGKFFCRLSARGMGQAEAALV